MKEVRFSAHKDKITLHKNKGKRLQTFVKQVDSADMTVIWFH